MSFQFPNRDGQSPGVVIVGAGLAGLFTALKLAPMPVTVIAAAPVGRGAASAWAQGGIAAAVGEGDTPSAHAMDTIRAGDGLVDDALAHAVAAEGPDRVRDLLRYGVPFDRDLEGHFLQSREAAHSRKRVVRVSGDRAGAAIMQAVVSAVRKTSSIRLIEGFRADDLHTRDGRVDGVYVVPVEERRQDERAFIPARAVLLAMGGSGGLFRVTTNPEFARGEAIALGARAGAAIADAEFVQFHPTAIDVDADPAPLASEALRGEGAVLVNAAGERFMAGWHRDGDMAPRDIVARAVFAEIAAGHGAFLDARDAIGPNFKNAFPTVYAAAKAAGIDPEHQLIPIAPAAHYHMGGIATDASGRSTVPGLWVVGEAASTGLHGANRLASNSLLEAAVFGARAADDIAGQVDSVPPVAPHGPATAGLVPRSDPAARSSAIAALRQTMTRHVGVIRDASGLREALRALDGLGRAAKGDQLLSNMVLCSRFIAAAALMREESRGAHFRSDFPEKRFAKGVRRHLTLSELDAFCDRLDVRGVAAEAAA